MTEGDDPRLTFLSESEADTERFAAALGRALEPGTVIALIGNLGAGKTRVVQGIAEACGIARDDVSSPTFSLINEYEGHLPLFHFDTYRLRDEDEFLELGSEEIMAGTGVCLIEWADRFLDLLPRDRVELRITAVGEMSRRLELSATGPRSAELIRRISL